MAFHPDGRRLAAAISDGTARIWNLDTDEHIEFRGHAGEVNMVAFAPDGKLLATVSDDATVRLWDPDTARPYWRGPLLFRTQPGERPLLLSHRGWIRLGTSVSAEPEELSPTRWRRAVERRARYAVQAPSGSPLCLLTHDGALEIWDWQADERLAEHREGPLERVIAVPNGCVATNKAEAAAAGQARLFTASGSQTELDVKGAITALGWGGEQILVAAGGEVFLFDPSGAPTAHHGADTGVSAVTLLGMTADRPGAVLVVGYRDGNIELVPTDRSEPKSAFAFERVPSSPVERLVAGPMNTIVAGFANGVVGIWDLDDGARFEHARIHGPIIHLLLDGPTLYAASALGQHLVWDLSVFHQDHCELVRQIWKRVPVVWEDGRAVERRPDRGHRCYVR